MEFTKRAKRDAKDSRHRDAQGNSTKQIDPNPT